MASQLHHLKKQSTYSKREEEAKEEAEEEEAKEKEEEEKDFLTVWNEFQNALKDIHRPFNEWYWLYTLTEASKNHVLLQCKNKKPLRILLAMVWQIQRFVISLIPFLTLSIIVFISWSYYTYLRQRILSSLLSSSSSSSPCTTHTKDTTTSFTCPIMPTSIHDYLVMYLVIQITFHYLCTVLTSPGIVGLELQSQQQEGEEDTETKEDQKVLKSDTVVVGKDSFSSSSSSSSLYHKDDEYYYYYFPSPESSYCKKCHRIRPCRAHHCSTCQQCILQMDHHCHWVNNCIGQWNYRSFILTLVYLNIGVYYGMYLLLPLIVELWKQQEQKQVQEYNTVILTTSNYNIISIWKHIYTFFHQVCQFLDISYYESFKSIFFWTSIQQEQDPIMIKGGGDDLQTMIVLKVVFTILFTFSFFLTPLLYTHIHLLCCGITTLERIIEMDLFMKNNQNDADTNTLLVLQPPFFTQLSWWKKRHRLFKIGFISKREKRMMINPFDQGWKQNIKQILGESIVSLFLPIYVHQHYLPKPYIPLLSKIQKKKNSKKTN